MGKTGHSSLLRSPALPPMSPILKSSILTARNGGKAPREPVKFTYSKKLRSESSSLSASSDVDAFVFVLLLLVFPSGVFRVGPGRWLIGGETDDVLDDDDVVEVEVEVEGEAEATVVIVVVVYRVPLGPATGGGDRTVVREDWILVRQTGQVFAVCSHC